MGYNGKEEILHDVQSFKDDIEYSMEDILALLAEYQKRGVTEGNIPELSEFSYEDLENILRKLVIMKDLLLQKHLMKKKNQIMKCIMISQN
mgnify:CR=1 FL=1